MIKKEQFINQIKTLIIETTNACNYHCSMCPREKMTRPVGTMSFELFKKIIDEVQNYRLEEIDLNSFGEPLLDPLLIKRIEYIRKKMGNITICFNSNGSHLKGDIARGLIDNEVEEIRLSIYTTTPESYKKVTRYGDFENVKNNIIKFSELKKKLGKTKPRVKLGFLYVQNIKEDPKKWKDFWEKYVDEFSANEANLHNFFGGRVYCDINKKIKRMTCGRVHQIANILQNGDITICCVDFNGQVVLGNIRDKSLKEILESEPYQRIVKIHEGDFRNCSIPLCDNCSILLPSTLRNRVARWMFLHIKRRHIGR